MSTSQSPQELHTPPSDATSSDRRRAENRLLEHLVRNDAVCFDDDCPICDNEMIKADVGRLRLAQHEFDNKVLPLRTTVKRVLCVYCGSPWSERDHLLPRGWSGEALRRYVPTVPSCSSCNNILSAFPEPLIAARVEHIARRLRRHWSRLLSNSPNLNGLRGNLRQQITANNFRRDVIRGRLVVLDLGGVPELPQDWQDVLISDGPAALAAGEPSPVAPARTTRTQHRPRWESPVIGETSTTGRRARGQKGPTRQTPGSAYLARKEGTAV